MRSVKLLRQLANNLVKVNGFYRQRNQENWPMCIQCGIPVGMAQIADAGPDPANPMYVEILARCDGINHSGPREDYARADFPTAIPLDKIAKTVLSTAQFFVPGHGIGGEK